jgi:hypothetical protein
MRTPLATAGMLHMVTVAETKLSVVVLMFSKESLLLSTASGRN